MPNSELPDELPQWPDDPFEVLGVTRGASDVEIKRAYNRLLRRFKPERFPDHFRRLRDCYESCLNQSPWYRGTAEVEPAEPVEPAAPGPTDPAKELWQAAIAGRKAEAYSGLCELIRSYPERRDLPLRLYWLLTVQPDLDPARTRHDWLSAALEGAGLAGSAAELYRRELAADAAATLGGRYERLLASTAEADALHRIAAMRIDAAGRIGDVNLLLADLRILQMRRAELGDPIWLALLVQTAAWSSWDDWPLVQELLKSELAQLRHLELSHSHFFDRLEELRTTAEYRFHFENGPLAALKTLVRIAWAGSEPQDDALIERVAAAVAAELEACAEGMARVRRHFGPGVLWAVAMMFRDYLEPHDRADLEVMPQEVVWAVAWRLRRWLAVGRYAQTLPTVVRTLAEEGIEPGEFAAALEAQGGLGGIEYSERMKDDVVFRIVWLALRITNG